MACMLRERPFLYKLASNLRILASNGNRVWDPAGQVADVVVRAMEEGRTRHAPIQAAAGEEPNEAEEWTAEELSDAALLASSVLAVHGPAQV